MEFKDEYLEKRYATFGELKKNILAQDLKSKYKQASIIIIRNAYIDLELCEGRTQPTSEQLEHDALLETVNCVVCGKALTNEETECGNTCDIC